MKTTKIARVAAVVMALILALSISSFATVDFVDSVGFKPIPPYENPDLPEGVEIIITPIGDADKQTDPRLTESMENLKTAFNELKDAKKYGDIVKEADLEKAIGLKDGEKYDVNNLDVSHLVDFWSSDGKGYEIKNIGLELGEKDICVGLFRNPDGSWITLTPDQFKVNPDGSVTVNFPGHGELAILIDVGGQEDIVPDTSDPAKVWIWVAVIAVAAVALTVVLVSLRKKKED